MSFINQIKKDDNTFEIQDLNAIEKPSSAQDGQFLIYNTGASKWIGGNKATDFDATGAAAAVLGTSSDVYSVNTVFGAKAYSDKIFNDSKSYTNAAVTGLGKVMNYKGSVANESAVKAISSAKAGDMYIANDDGAEWVAIRDITSIDATAWEKLGPRIDFSSLISKPSNPNDGQVLTYDGTAEQWIAGDAKGGGASFYQGYIDCPVDGTELGAWTEVVANQHYTLWIGTIEDWTNTKATLVGMDDHFKNPIQWINTAGGFTLYEVTENTKIDLQPDASVMLQMDNDLTIGLYVTVERIDNAINTYGDAQYVDHGFQQYVPCIMLHAVGKCPSAALRLYWTASEIAREAQ